MKKLVLIALVMTVVFAVPAFSQMKNMDMKGRHADHGRMMGTGTMCAMDKMGDMMDMCLEHANKLGLSDDQITKITAIHRTLQKKQAQAKADLKVAEIDQMEIMDVKDFDIDKASSTIKKIGDIQTDRHLEMLKSMQEVRAILTDDQYKNMRKMMPMMMDGKKADKTPMKKHRGKK